MRPCAHPLIIELLGRLQQDEESVPARRHARPLPIHTDNTEAVAFRIGQNNVIRIRWPPAPMDFSCTQSYQPPHFIGLIFGVKIKMNTRRNV